MANTTAIIAIVVSAVVFGALGYIYYRYRRARAKEAAYAGGDFTLDEPRDLTLGAGLLTSFCAFCADTAESYCEDCNKPLCRDHAVDGRCKWCMMKPRAPKRTMSEMFGKRSKAAAPADAKRKKLRDPFAREDSAVAIDPAAVVPLTRHATGAYKGMDPFADPSKPRFALAASDDDEKPASPLLKAGDRRRYDFGIAAPEATKRGRRSASPSAESSGGGGTSAASAAERALRRRTPSGRVDFAAFDDGDAVKAFLRAEAGRAPASSPRRVEDHRMMEPGVVAGDGGRRGGDHLVESGIWTAGASGGVTASPRVVNAARRHLRDEINDLHRSTPSAGSSAAAAESYARRRYDDGDDRMPPPGRDGIAHHHHHDRRYVDGTRGDPRLDHFRARSTSPSRDGFGASAEAMRRDAGLEASRERLRGLHGEERDRYINSLL